MAKSKLAQCIEDGRRLQRSTDYTAQRIVDVLLPAMQRMVACAIAATKHQGESLAKNKQEDAAARALLKLLGLAQTPANMALFVRGY